MEPGNVKKAVLFFCCCCSVLVSTRPPHSYPAPPSPVDFLCFFFPFLPAPPLWTASPARLSPPAAGPASSSPQPPPQPAGSAAASAARTASSARFPAGASPPPSFFLFFPPAEGAARMVHAFCLAHHDDFPCDFHLSRRGAQNDRKRTSCGPSDDGDDAAQLRLLVLLPALPRPLAGAARRRPLRRPRQRRGELVRAPHVLQDLQRARAARASPSGPRTDHK